jgi:GntR family transcriptional regulator/MocR family aminotransferase
VGRRIGEFEETTGFVDQLAMAEFITAGSYDRQIRTMRAQYRRRREQLVAAVARSSPGTTVAGMPAGLQVLLEIDGADESELCRQRAWRRMGVEGLDRFRHPDADSTRNGLLVGFAAPAPSAWSAALDALVRMLP